ncbi:hypothetical protein KAW38_03835 [Candidatus Micrarchaeota archaeon]|nr:hypothetical protein [Candidatus Micrarchaeota archaeon]
MSGKKVFRKKVVKKSPKKFAVEKTPKKKAKTDVKKPVRVIEKKPLLTGIKGFVIINKDEDENYFYLDVNRNKLKFNPGQFVKFYPNPEDPEKFIAVSIASGTEEKILRFIIDRRGKLVSGISDLVIGDRVHIEGPYGEFLKGVKRGVFFAKKASIAPILSISKNLEKGMLFYENMKRKEISMEEELKKKKNMKTIFVLMNEQPMGWEGELRRIDEVMLKQHISSPKKKEYYLCGPSSFVNRIKELLLSMGIPDEKIKDEKWD